MCAYTTEETTTTTELINRNEKIFNFLKEITLKKQYMLAKGNM